MLSMKELKKVYRAGQVETWAIHEMSLDVAQGEFVAITGPSGSGKTTLLNIMGLLETSTGGSYCLDGQEVSSMTDRERSQIRNQKLGFIFQGFNLIPELSVADNVEVPLRYRKMSAKARRDRVSDSLDQMGLLSRASHYPSELSGGQQQRVAIARALAGEPKVLLADEPTGNLNSQMARAVMDLLENINEQGTTIVMVTHDPDLAVRARRGIHVVDGRVSEIEQDPNLMLQANP